MYRSLPNGDLFVPRKGNNPPACPEGYSRDVGDEWVFHPCLNKCKYRRERIDPTCNCKSKIVLWCDFLNQRIRLGQCKECCNGVQA
jgi:hypothetical protein